MNTGNFRLTSFWGQSLQWYQISLSFNWIVLPIVGGLVISSLLLQTQYSDVYDVLRAAPVFTVQGTTRVIGLKTNKRVEITQDSQKISARCGILPNDGSYCLPTRLRNNKITVVVSLAKYNSVNMIMAIEDSRGNLILTPRYMLKQHAVSAKNAADGGFSKVFVLAILAILVSCSPLRYFASVKPSRKKLEQESSDDNGSRSGRKSA